MSCSISLVATLIANPAKENFTSSFVDKISQSVNATGFDILGQHSAIDVFLPIGLDDGAAYEALKNVIDAQEIDIIIQPLHARRKKLLLADMDSTMIEQECIDELAQEIGLRDHIADLTKRAMNGEMDFDAALRARVKLLKGLGLDVIDKVLHNRITYKAGGKTLLATMRHNGAYTSLVSGGFTLFTEKIAATLAFHEHHANRLCHDGCRLTGEVEEPILGAKAKLDRLLALCERLTLSPEEVMAVGDGANDLPMLQHAGSGVALHAKPMVAQAAKMRVDYGDLTALLYIQGYHEQEFIV